MRALSLLLLLGGLLGCGSGSTDVDGGPGRDTPGTDAGPLPPDPCVAAGTCPAGTWVHVTPPELSGQEFGPGPIVVDPAHPSDLYLAGSDLGVWGSHDYGNTWSLLNDEIGYIAQGLILAVAGTTPATVYVAGYPGIVHRSTDGGRTYEAIGEGLPGDLYSLEIDPYDDQHILSGLHEADGLVESTDGGAHWRVVGGTGFPAGGVSWYPFFVDTGDAAGTRGTWVAIAQGGGSVTITRDGGASWTIPTGIEGLEHGHGNAQIFQRGTSLWIGGNNGPGQGVYRSTDLGATFSRVSDDMPVGVVWGTETHVYSMWSWACSHCNLGALFSSAPLPAGDSWTVHEVPEALIIGANHVAVTSDGTHTIFVATMWSEGIWRYVEE